MVIYGCIQIYPNSSRGWIIIMRFRVLLITYYLIREILVEGILDVHARGVTIKKNSRSIYCNDASSTKRIHVEILVLVCILRTICSSRYSGRKDGCVNF
jgi:hypothetical protein